RLSGVTRLVPAGNGIIWGLLDGAVVRIGFPSAISNFEPFIGTGITMVHPYRVDGDLWMNVDGRLYRGEYDAAGRLVTMSVDTPAQLFATNFGVMGSVAIAGTEHGAFYRGSSGWLPFAPTLNNFRVLTPAPIDGRWLFSAQGEIGWIKPGRQGFEIVEEIPTAALGKVHNSVSDSRGIIWLEIGSGRVGKIHFENGVPIFSILTADDGVPQTWAQIFAIDGVVRFNFAEHIFRFDEGSHRIVPDEDFVRTLPTSITSVIGRPGKDARGRCWVTAGGAVHILDQVDGVWQERTTPLEIGFQPYLFTFEDGGIVWMHGLHRLARYDPAMPVAPTVPLRALISHLSLITSNRSWFNLNRDLPRFDYSENSFVAHFVASGNKFAAPVQFDVKLEGSETEWISVGSSGSAAFNRLKEGKYVLHVRPRSGTTIGTEATLAFSILPPWYRSSVAYLAYGLSAAGLVLLVGWLMTLLERRENARLERVVAERTGELSKSNAQLAHQVEEIRVLTRAIVQSPIAVFITSPEGVIEFVNPRSCELTGCEAARLTGSNINEIRAPNLARPLLAEISSALARGESWSGQLAYRRPDGRLVEVRSSISPILSPDGQARHHLVLEEDITEWLADQQRNRRLQAQLTQAQKTESIGTLAGGIAHDFNNILTGILGYCELARLAADGQMDVRPDLQQIRVAGLRAKDLVMQILTFSRQSNTKLVPIELAGPVAEALKLIRASTPATIEIVEKLEPGAILADATQIHQVMINLCTNAVH
ncbi:MAG: PAS domain S-box protein, partial [Lacunisphaera sp.]